MPRPPGKTLLLSVFATVVSLVLVVCVSHYYMPTVPTPLSAWRQITQMLPSRVTRTQVPSPVVMKPPVRVPSTLSPVQSTPVEVAAAEENASKSEESKVEVGQDRASANVEPVQTQRTASSTSVPAPQQKTEPSLNVERPTSRANADQVAPVQTPAKPTKEPQRTPAMIAQKAADDKALQTKAVVAKTASVQPAPAPSALAPQVATAAPLKLETQPSHSDTDRTRQLSAHEKAKERYNARVVAEKAAADRKARQAKATEAKATSAKQVTRPERVRKSTPRRADTKEESEPVVIRRYGILP